MSPSGTKGRLAVRGEVFKRACSLAVMQTCYMHGIYLGSLDITNAGLGRTEETNTNTKLGLLAVL